MKLKSLNDKESISAVLSKSLRMLTGNAMGRSIVTDCALREYMEGEDEWKKAVKKAIEKESFLKEIVEGDICNNKKRKRKRKKKDNEEDANKTMKLADDNEDD
jgi:pectin methylesterase-like acyl-CoA thioesterase